MTQSQFDHLLRRLDDDRELAAAAYLALCNRLINYCRLKGHSAPEEGAEETLDRVAAKLEAGEPVQEVAKYSYGIARFICLENYRKQSRVQKLSKEISIFQSLQKAFDDRIFHLMSRCFDQLPTEEKSLLHDYYAEAEGKDLNHYRLEMARRLNITMNSLRLRIHRLRLGLETCLKSNRSLLS